MKIAYTLVVTLMAICNSLASVSQNLSASSSSSSPERSQRETTESISHSSGKESRSSVGTSSPTRGGTQTGIVYETSEFIPGDIGLTYLREVEGFNRSGRKVIRIIRDDMKEGTYEVQASIHEVFGFWKDETGVFHRMFINGTMVALRRGTKTTRKVKEYEKIYLAQAPKG